MERNRIPDKLIYTAGEKAAEIASGALTAAAAAATIVFMALGAVGGYAVILLVVMLILYGAFTLCSVYPQYTNVLGKAENADEKKLRTVRRGSIAAKFILTAALFVLAMLP